MADYRIFMRTEKCRDILHEVNEDRYLAVEYRFMNDEKIRVLAVADGMGGLEDADQASFNAMEGFSVSFYQELMKEYLYHDGNHFSITHYAEKLENIIRYAIKEANRNVCKKAAPFTCVGTTLSVAVAAGDYVIIANVGDSPIYYYCLETEEFRLISKVQTRAERDVETGLYERYSGQYYSRDHIILKSLGEEEELQEEDIFMKNIGYLRPGDLLLMGTDGAFGRMREDEIFEMITGYKENIALKMLFERAREDKEDDQTAILYKVWEEE